MRDLEIAQAMLQTEGLSLIFMKDGRVVYRSGQPGLKPLVDAIRICGRDLEGSSMADKIVGRAAALLAIYTQVSSIYASTLGSDAAQVLERHGVRYRYGQIVEWILNRAGTDLCPFEKSVSDTADPAEAYRRIVKIVYPSAVGQ